MKHNYTIEVTAAQAEIIARACELISRIQSGQWPEAHALLPKDDSVSWHYWHESQDQIGQIMKTVLKGGIDGVASSFGVGSSETPASTDTAWDLHQVIRHRLAWDNAIDNGLAESEQAHKDWRAMIGVAYDPPMQFGPEPLAKIKRKSR